MTLDRGDAWLCHRCACGRFTRWGCDSLTVWGNSFDLEPPDPQALCDRCADETYRRYLAEFIARGLPKWEHRPFWQAPDCYRRARAVYRGMRKHGLLPKREAA